MATSELDTFNLRQLQEYLRDRGVTVTGYNKHRLLTLAKSVRELDLPVDPNLARDSTDARLTNRLNELGCTVKDPLYLPGYTSDFSDIPDFGIHDIFNYLICHRADYDRRKLNDYKSYEDFRLYHDGHVESLLYNPMSATSKLCFFKAKVKPTQRDQTYLKANFYDLWFGLEKSTGEVQVAYCVCPGGADGACRHLAASLYALEAYEKQSVTDGECQWTKKARTSDNPGPIKELQLMKCRYGISDVTKKQRQIDTFDPRLPFDRREASEEDITRFARKLQEMVPDANALEALLPPDEITAPSDKMPNSTACLQFSVLEILSNFQQSKENRDSDFLAALQLSPTDCEAVEAATRGQSENKLWCEMRKGRLTASNFKRIRGFMEGNADHSKCGKNVVKLIMGLTTIPEDRLPASLEWGRRKEQRAREMYRRVEGKKHLRMKVEETGFHIGSENPYLGCSLDGIVSCACASKHEQKHIEIKCPYAKRNCYPKDVASELGCEIQNGQWVVTPKCPYYDQIVGQLGIMHFSTCDLVIFTNKGIHISVATYDDEYFTSLKTVLSDFYSSYIIPHLMELGN